MSVTEPERIVVRAPNWIGDVVLSLPALRDVRRNFPRARLEVLARSWVSGLYGAVKEVDGVVESRGVRADVDLLRGHYDTAVMLPNSIASALPPFLARIPQRWGYATSGRAPLLTRGARVQERIRRHSQVFYYRAMLAGVGLSVSAIPDASLACRPEWQTQGGRLLDDAPAGWIGLNPGASYGGAKRWLPERYATVGDAVHEATGARIAIVGGEEGRSLAEKVAALMRAPATVLAGRTSLPELAGVLSHLRLLVTNDSGPMHLAAALGVPLVAVFGPTDWRETAPWGTRTRIVREPVECAPCGLRECPIDHRCMTGVRASRVVDAALELLAARAETSRKLDEVNA